MPTLEQVLAEQRAIERLKRWLVAYYAASLTAGVGLLFWAREQWPASDLADLTDPKLVVYVLLVGALGGWTHGLYTLGVHAGLRNLQPSWWLFYAARPFVGAGMAFIVCLVARSGIIGLRVDDNHRAFMLLAWAGLTGLLTSTMMQMLKDRLKRQEQDSATRTAGAETTKQLPAAVALPVQVPKDPVAPPPPPPAMR